MRGIIMMVMALDHVNLAMLRQPIIGESWLRVHRPIVVVEMTSLQVLCFVIRTVVSFPVMPGFAFLMGIGIQLLMHARHRQKWSPMAIWRFFLMRGISLALPCNAAVAATTLLKRALRLGDEFTFQLNNTILFALGINMIITSSVILLARASSFGARNNLDAVVALLLGPLCILYTQKFVDDAPAVSESSLLSVVFLLPGNIGWFSNYNSALPFLGVTFLGVAFGRWHTLGLARRSPTTSMRWFLPLLFSLILLTSFITLRLSDAWGNTFPLRLQVKAGVPGWVAFFSLTKYPPSLVYHAYTLGASLRLHPES